MLTNFRDLMVHDEYEHFLTDIKNDCYNEMEILSLKIQAYKFNDFTFDNEFIKFLKACIDTKLAQADPFVIIHSLLLRAKSNETKNTLLDIYKIYKTLTFVVAYSDFHNKPINKNGIEQDPIFSDEFVNMMEGDFIGDVNTIVLMPLISVLYYSIQE